MLELLLLFEIYANIVASNNLLYEHQYLQQITSLTWRLNIEIFAQKQIR